jgi:predicted HNH restriction endonuclease
MNNYRAKTDYTKCRLCGEETNSNSFIEIHHITERNVFKKKNRKVDNEKRNLLNVCPNCHSKIHLKEITIDRWYMTTKGMQIGYYSKGDDKLRFG